MIGKSIQPEIRALIEARDFATLKEIFVDWYPADLAELIDSAGEFSSLLLREKREVVGVVSLDR